MMPRGEDAMRQMMEAAAAHARREERMKSRDKIPVEAQLVTLAKFVEGHDGMACPFEVGTIVTARSHEDCGRLDEKYAFPRPGEPAVVVQLTDFCRWEEKRGDGTQCDREDMFIALIDSFGDPEVFLVDSYYFEKFRA